MGAEDVSFKTISDQVGYIPAVIDVGMGEDHSSDGFGIEREVFIPVERFLPFSLEEAAFEENFFTVYRKNMS